jgi:hypothetical protein
MAVVPQFSHRKTRLNPNCPCPVDKSGHIGTGGIAGTKLLEEPLQTLSGTTGLFSGFSAITSSIGG